MRSRARAAALAAVLSLVSLAAKAAPIVPPVDTDAYGWADGESRKFSLDWDGHAGSFTVDKVGTSSFTVLNQCCSDVFARIQDLHPGGSLLITQLKFNTMPISTTFVDDLNMSLLSDQLHNLRTLTGLLTLNLPADLRRSGQVLLFDSPAPLLNEPPAEHSSQTPVPEPATLLLVGTGMVGLARALRRTRHS